MTLTCYCLSGSPFSWKVLLALEYQNIDYELRVLSADVGDLKKPEFLAINPRHKVPAIIDNGFTLYESSAIIEYLHDQYGATHTPLWPDDVTSKALARRVACEADNYIYPPVRKMVSELLMRREGKPDPGIIAESRQSLAKDFHLMNEAFSGDYVAGKAPSAADFTLYPFTAILRRIDDKQPGQDIQAVLPARMKQWMQRIEALSFYAKTYPPHWKS